MEQSKFCATTREYLNRLMIAVTPMKWLGGGDGDVSVKVDMDRGPQRTQDDAAVGYVFQRPPDPEFPPFGPKQARWALGDDSIIDVSMHLISLSVYSAATQLIKISNVVTF